MIFDKDDDDDGVCDDTRYFYCRQANYNVVALTNSSGTVVEKIEYDPYGEYTLTLDGSTGNPYLFQGRRWDSEADPYYFRNRSYSPRLGRFMQRDRVGYRAGMNLYDFVGGRALIRLDPPGTAIVALNSDVLPPPCFFWAIQEAFNTAVGYAVDTARELCEDFTDVEGMLETAEAFYDASLMGETLELAQVKHFAPTFDFFRAIFARIRAVSGDWRRFAF